jgi:multicomponent Na+:H+ antiporter subunit G
VIVDVLTGICLLVGAALSLTGAIGLLRFPDVLSRLHAATKPQVLGLMLVLAAVGLQQPDWGTISTLVLISVFQMMTAPVSAHMLGRAGYRTRRLRQFPFTRDELALAVQEASARSDEDGGDGDPGGGSAYPKS